MGLNATNHTITIDFFSKFSKISTQFLWIKEAITVFISNNTPIFQIITCSTIFRIACIHTRFSMFTCFNPYVVYIEIFKTSHIRYSGINIVKFSDGHMNNARFLYTFLEKWIQKNSSSLFTIMVKGLLAWLLQQQSFKYNLRFFNSNYDVGFNCNY